MDTAVEQEPELAAEIETEKKKEIAEINAAFEEQKAWGETVLEQQEARNPTKEIKEKLEIAKYHEELYWRGQKTYNQVFEGYQAAKNIDPHHWECWSLEANFFARAGISEIEKGIFVLGSKVDPMSRTK